MKRITAAAAAILLSGTILCACTDKKSPEYRYNHAVELMNSGEYAEAADEFASLNGYKDSAALSRASGVRSLRSGNIHAGDTVRFGDYKGCTEWRVLTVSESEAYITTTGVVDQYQFDKSGCYWNTSSIRAWLNEHFMNEAFTDEEREMIVTKNGDSILLLSIEEAYRYFKDDADRYTETGDNPSTGYWLRNQGIYSDHASMVEGEALSEGVISEYGGLVYYPRGVRPAVWIRLDGEPAVNTDEKEEISESGYFYLKRSGSDTDLTGLTEEGRKQEDLVIPAGVKIFGSISNGRVKNLTFESDDDIDYGYLCAGSYTLETLKLPANLTKLGHLSNCPHLNEIVIPEGVRAIPVSCFEYDTALERVIIKGNVTEIPNSAFIACESLEEINLPDSVTSIGTLAFAYCQALREITLPKGLKTMGERIFEDSGIKVVTVPEEMELTDWENAFDSGEISGMPRPALEYTVRVRKGSWADEHFDEVFVGKAIKEYYS